MLLQEPSIQDSKGLYWKVSHNSHHMNCVLPTQLTPPSFSLSPSIQCFVVASRQAWTAALPQLKSSLTYSRPQFPATIHGVNLNLDVMRIPKSVWETRGRELGISSMCVNPRGGWGVFVLGCFVSFVFSSVPLFSSFPSLHSSFNFTGY